ncbi:MAG: hypothetical protein K2Y32_16235 [Candidatus Obscuribacterales bacterium]|nr:hypothetical protein [Candidatus Obscuribacterales bacterium]
MDTFMIELVLSLGVMLFGLICLAMYLIFTGWWRAYRLRKRVESVERMLASGAIVLRPDQKSRLENARTQLGLELLYEAHGRGELTRHLSAVQSQLDFLNKQALLAC